MEKVTKDNPYYDEILEMVSDDVGCHPSEILFMEYDEEEVEHNQDIFCLFIYFKTASMKVLEVDLNSDLAHAILY